MPRNPFNDPLFAATLIRIALLAGAALILILIVERGRLRQWRQSVLVIRLGSWMIMAPTFAVGVFAKGVVSLALVAYMTVQGTREFGKLVGLKATYFRAMILYGLFGLAVTAWWGSRFFLFLPIGFFAIATLVPIFRLRRKADDQKAELLQGAAAALGYIWIPLFLSYFVLIGRTEEHSVAILLLLGFSVALSDIAAFTAGRIAGGPKLVSAVSPNKTIGGLAGNIAGAYLGFAIMGFAIPSDWTGLTRLVLPLIIGLGSAWGDLVESLVKRAFGTKDAGTLLPGFGGLLDRVDSLLVALPLAYYGLKVLQHYTV